MIKRKTFLSMSGNAPLFGNSALMNLNESNVFQPRTTETGDSERKVTVYSTNGCSWCNALKLWLHENHVIFTDIDISGNQEAASEMIRLSGQEGVPQTYVNGKLVLGFDQQRLEDLLGING